MASSSLTVFLTTAQLKVKIVIALKFCVRAIFCSCITYISVLENSKILDFIGVYFEKSKFCVLG